MPTRTIYIRRRILEKLIEITKKEGYIEQGKPRWHHVLNELLEQAIALYEMGYIKLKKQNMI